MAPIAIVFGLLLTLLGGGTFGYVYQSKAELQYTALIPAGFGILLIILGFVARNEKARMHAMHGAALLGLIGFAVPTGMVALALFNGKPFEPVKHGEQIAMAGLCLLFVGSCVKSFIDARVARKKREAEACRPGESENEKLENPMTATKSIAEINRELGEWVLEDAKCNRQSYAGRYVGIANGKVVIATNDLNELAHKLGEADPDNAATYSVILDYDYSKPFEIWEVH